MSIFTTTTSPSVSNTVHGTGPCDEVIAKYNATWTEYALCFTLYYRMKKLTNAHSPESRPIVTKFLKVLYVMSMLTVLISFIIMRIKWGSYARLRARGFVFFLATTLGVLVFLQSGPLQDFLGKEHIPCLWNLISSNMVIPLIGGALVGRLLDSMNKTNLARAMMKVPLDQADPTTTMARTRKRKCPCPRTLSMKFSATSLSSSSASVPSSRIKDRTRMRKNWSSSREQSDYDLPPATMTPTRHHSGEEDEEADRVAVTTTTVTPYYYVSKREFSFWREISARPGRICTMFIILLPFIIASLVLIIMEPASYLNGCRGCAFSPAGLQVLVFSASGIFLFALLASLRVSYARFRHADPFGIVQECRWSFLLGGLPAIVFFALDKWAPYNSPHFSWIILEVFAVLIMFFIHGPLQLFFAVREGWTEDKVAADAVQRKSTLAAATMLSLEDILDDPVGIVVFENFLVSIWASESLRFYIEARKWQASYHDMGQRTALARAKRIVRVFIDLNGSMTVNLDHSIVNDLLGVLKAEDSTRMDPTLFDAAVYEIVKLMRSDGFFRFRDTPAYRSFADEGLRQHRDASSSALLQQEALAERSSRGRTLTQQNDELLLEEESPSSRRIARPTPAAVPDDNSEQQVAVV